MTLTATPAISDGRPLDDVQRWNVPAGAGHAAIGSALVVWGFVLTHGTGGRDRWVLSLAIAVTLAATAIVRPWRVVPAGTMLLAAAVGLAPAAVCLIDPTHWFGASQAAAYSYSALLFLLVLGYATSAGRRLAIVGVVLAAGVAQFAWALIPWVGAGDPTGILLGTFYWHNQLAAFLLAPTVIGAGLAGVGRGPLRLAGAAVAVLGTAGIVLSTSRASMGLMVLGWLVAGGLAVLSQSGARARRRALTRVSATALVAALVTYLLPGPPLFTSRAGALAATSVRNGQESLGQNGGVRLHFWHEALQLFARHPLAGTGFDSFGLRAYALDPNGGHSTLVHSGYLQPLNDGGLLLGAPFLLACALVFLGLLRRLGRAAWTAESGLVALVATGSLVLAAHSAVDFDWTYPSLMAMNALLAAVALSWSSPRGGTRQASNRSSVPAFAVLAAAAVLLAIPAVRGGWTLSAHPNTPDTTFLHGVSAP